MEVTLKKIDQDILEVIEIQDDIAMRETLTERLYVPDERLKPKVVSEIVKYYGKKFASPEPKAKFFVAKQGKEIVGFVFCQIDDEYKSYGMKCPTFGWLYAQNYDVCKELIEKCEQFVRDNKFRKLRGPVNFPKLVGGIGFQTEGFHAPMINGVAYNDPNSKVLEYMEKIGYAKESKYSCLEVTISNWSKGNRLDKGLMIRFLPTAEIRKLRPKILALAQSSFHSVLADAPGGQSRFEEMMKIYDLVFENRVAVKKDFDPTPYSSIPEFIDSWESCDLNNIVPCCPVTFDRNSGELVGIIIALPNLFQLWNNDTISHLNVDTAIVKKEYAGRGIFSSMQNVGQITSRMYGIDYVEGTTIWANNERAIKTIFPHCTPLRTHYVVQKRILRK